MTIDLITLRSGHDELLRAVLGRGESASQSYARWQSLVRFDDVEPEAYRLLPWLYCRLQTAGVSDDLLPRLRGIFRRSWYANQLACDVIGETAKALAGAGIETRTIGGGLSILHEQRIHGIYPIDAFDMLAGDRHHEAAADVLMARGWTSVHRTTYASTFSHGQAGVLTLHRRIVHGLNADSHAAASAAVWDRPRIATVAATPIVLVNPEAELLFLAESGLAGGALTPLRLLLEAGALLTGATGIDWDALIVQARTRHAEGSLGRLVRSIDSVVPGVLPDGFMDRLMSLRPPTEGEQVVARAPIAKTLIARLRRACGSLWGRVSRLAGRRRATR